jgi:uncharacterized protein YyaL (SSP411 family)
MNRLSKSNSPYLLQHADNPVDWHEWGNEAFEKARKDDKPVFLSIGYATCHWCHVMAHESFEDGEVASLMNQAFVNIKVDREERPDIDNTYMTICQMLTGSGGWPLTIVMTPDKEPFFAATYIPKDSFTNRIGMIDLIPRIELAWKTDRDNILSSVKKIHSGFQQTLSIPPDQEINSSILTDAFENLKQRYDPDQGGFGNAPKFPTPHNLSFLIRYAGINEQNEAMHMALHTLNKMRSGGIWDHIGFGFHRYSTDRHWLLPHFEKMLYDQALLIQAYTDAWKQTQNPLYRQTILEIYDYLCYRMTSPEGGFYSAEDADSEGVEGKFYVWKSDEIDKVLIPDDAEWFSGQFNIQKEGNFHEEATGKMDGTNIPHLKAEITDQSRYDSIRKNLFQQREQRVHPLLDDKILTDWNGLMISALAHAGIVLSKPGLIHSAEMAWKFIEQNLISDGKLLHRYRNGEAGIDGMADDYAFLISGLISLHQSTLKAKYLIKAIELQEEMDNRFLDNENGGYYFTSENSEQILGRQKEIYDGALPSSNSITAKNLLRLFSITGNSGYKDQLNRLFHAFSSQLNDAPQAYTAALETYLNLQYPSTEIVITASDEDDHVKNLLMTAREFAPANTVFLLITDKNKGTIQSTAPYTKLYPVSAHPAVYVCSDFKCNAPVHTVNELKKLLIPD